MSEFCGWGPGRGASIGTGNNVRMMLVVSTMLALNMQ